MTDYISREAANAQLKTCPFCGGKARIVEHEFYAMPSSYGVQCSNEDCSSQSDQFYDTMEEAIAAWNNRSADVKPVVRGEWQQVEVHENKRHWADQNVSAIASMYCPKCKRYHNEVYFHGDPVENVNFCPNCGADMRGKKHEDD